MRIAISSKGNTPETEVDLRFGRAQNFLIMDTEIDDFEVVDNTQNLYASQGAGIQAAQTLAEKSVEAVITGHCGPKAFKTLQSADINIFVTLPETVRTAFEKFKNGELKKIDQADTVGHW